MIITGVFGCPPSARTVSRRVEPSSISGFGTGALIVMLTVSLIGAIAEIGIGAAARGAAFGLWDAAIVEVDAITAVINTPHFGDVKYTKATTKRFLGISIVAAKCGAGVES